MCHITWFMCAPYLEKLKPTFLPGSIKRSSVHLTAIFAQPKPEKMYKTGHAACVPQQSQGRRRAARASDAVCTGAVCTTRRCGANCTSLLWTTPSTIGGVVCWLVSMLKADILNITYDCYCQIIMSKWQHCKFDNWRWLFLFSFAVNVNEQRIIAF